MCGLAGAVSLTPLEDEAGIRARAVLARRGPDASGVWQGYVGATAVLLAHTRLAIIDLDSRANQPFVRDDCILAFNGELYNYREIRSELQSLGERFETCSDTEVVVAACRRWGLDCLDRFEGMWAFALLDLRARELVLARDRFGEKPLFLWAVGRSFFFGSEVKALAALAGRWPSENMAQVRRYLVNGYRGLHDASSTFFMDVERLPPGTYLRLALDEWPTALDVEPVRYWALRYAPDRAMKVDEAAQGVRDRLIRAVDLRMRADVPVAFCLSGGVDSGVLASIAARTLGRDVHAFSIIDGDERYDERVNIAATVADLGCVWHGVETTTEGFLDRLAAQVAYHDSPVATISYYVHEFLSEAMSEAGFKVAISGTAADELFTGYFDHYGFWLAEMHGRPDFDGLLADWREGYGAKVRSPYLQDPLAFHREPARRDHLAPDRDRFNAWLVEPVAEELVEAEHADSLLRRRMMNELFTEVVPVILEEDDLNTMRWSVENRSPYLDRELVEFAYTIPNEHLILDGRMKWPLRAAASDILNDAVRLERNKRGFNASIDSLLDRNDDSVIDWLLAPSPIFDVVQRSAVVDLLQVDARDNSISKFVFSFVSAKMFLESPRGDVRLDSRGLTIGIVDYGLGNLASVTAAVRRLGEEPVVSADRAELERCRKMILPGVGAFGDGMRELRDRGLVDTLQTLVVERRVPILGICLGFQLIARKSDEFGEQQGLGWIDAIVTRLDTGGLPVPHMGWDDLDRCAASPLFADMPEDALFYYAHSYRLVLDREDDHVIGTCDYGGRFPAALERGNIHAVQFHPEKSQRHGLALLRNFMAHA